MTDDFEDYSSGLTSPATAAEAVTPNDSQDLQHVTRAIFVGQTGDLAVKLQSGDEVVLHNVQAGAVYAIRVSQVKATGTTATGLVGLR